MDNRPTTRDVFPSRREQTFIMAVVMAGFAAMMISTINRSLRNDGIRNVDDPRTRRTIRFAVNVNEAEWPEIAQLPSIGPVMAKRIVEYRQTNGPFRSVDDVTMVKGIGDKTFAAIAPHLTVGDLVKDFKTDISQTSPTVAGRPLDAQQQ